MPSPTRPSLPPAALSWLVGPEPGPILALGCSPGMIGRLTALGHGVLAVDADPARVARTASTYRGDEHVMTVVGRPDEMPLQPCVAQVVLVQGRPTSWGIVIRVADTGCGIPEEHLKELATPFKQVETELSRNHQGTGLGLALSKTLAEMHGGTLKIQSELGKGTIVSIFLPSRFGGRHDDDSDGGVDAPSDHPQGSPRGTVAA